MPAGRHPLHSLCSYLGCFPPSVPHQLIRERIPKGSVILDPFCGSGTTLVEAVLLGYPCIGIDLNPLAVALTQAKVQAVSVENALYRLLELARNYRSNVDIGSVPEGLRTIYHPRTLSQLIYLQGALDSSLPEDVFIRGALLGIMHGKLKKDGQDTIYLSIDMPNTFSMSPGYVSRFVKKHRLKQLPIDVFGKLRQRVQWLLREGALPVDPPRNIIRGDASRAPTLLSEHGVSRVDAIVTSPPYLGVLRYGAFNWIRLWFLGYEPAEVDRSLDNTDSLDRYLSFMTSFITSSGEVLPPGGLLLLVVGDVEEFGTRVELARRVWEELEGLVPFDLVSIEEDNFDETTKTTRIWGEERKGKATPRDKILILKRKQAKSGSLKVMKKEASVSDLPPFFGPVKC